MLEKEYLICFKAYYKNGEIGDNDIFLKTTERLGENKLNEVRETLKKRLNAPSVIFTSLVCLGEVEED